MRRLFALRTPAMITALVLLTLTAGSAQTRIKPGMNFFSIEQDIELGRNAAQEVEQKMPMLRDAEVDDYIKGLGRRLANSTNMPNLPWEFKVVNASDVNAFALPGGFIFVNRGLIEFADTEGQLASVLAHEISHVVLRHSTNQLSKAMVAQLPLSILGGITGGKGVIGQLAQLGIGVGANLAFMKFSRTAETQADINGVQVMAAAGYDPHEMIKMFEKLDQMHERQPGRIEGWFTSHPSPENRSGKIRQEIALLKLSRNLETTSPRFNAIRAKLRAMSPAPKLREIQSGKGHPSRKPDPPSRTLRAYQHPRGYFTVSYPSNWRVSEGGTGTVFVPDGGVAQTDNAPQIVYGAMLDIFEPHGSHGTRRRSSLDDATDKLIDHLMRGNPHLTQILDRKHERLAGADAVSVILSGSYHRGLSEKVWLIATWFDNDSIFYMAFIAPEEDFNQYVPTFREMARSLRLNA